MNFTDLIGFTGVLILLLAYFLSLFKYIRISGLLYILMNFTGAALACLASVLINYLPFIILEAAWATVSLAGIIIWVSRRKNA